MQIILDIFLKEGKSFFAFGFFMVITKDFGYINLFLLHKIDYYLYWEIINGKDVGGIDIILLLLIMGNS